MYTAELLELTLQLLLPGRSVATKRCHDVIDASHPMSTVFTRHDVEEPEDQGLHEYMLRIPL